MFTPTTSQSMPDLPRRFSENSNFNNGDHEGERNEFEGHFYAVSPAPSRRKDAETKASTIHIHPYINHHQRRIHIVSAKRTQEIARDRERLMELIQNIPEGCFELSLKDIVEKQFVQGNEKQSTVAAEVEGKTDEHANHSVIKATAINHQRKDLLKRGSMSRENITLNMFIPFPLAINNSSKLQSGSKVSPRYHLVQGCVDMGWWKKKFSSDGEKKTSDSGTMIKSSSCNRSRRFAVCLYGCWSSFDNKE